MTAPLLEQLTAIADQEGLPIAVGLFTDSPAPATYLVATPLSDVFDVFADNRPGVEIEEVRLAVFTTGNYLTTRDRLTRGLLDADLTVTARRYVGFEADTGYHHYAIDVASHHQY
ncbi:hypothetical protein FYJ24_08370 [Actinomycetaceae bacterium WB03_NA08]|jgi:hypothetical protein|uniref:Phage protein n=2 Tax=Actinomycetes TaxID=1760 RepID=W5XYJ9_9CORY|nr:MULTISPECIES: hypothetical protein [Actinomycetes]AHI22086.1 hypothetical protein B843_03475 [Corynebacterium vitaeruminis DSM 20294]MSS84776.1 hypothetical protein [Scrofimicrobium canadense]